MTAAIRRRHLLKALSLSPFLSSQLIAQQAGIRQGRLKQSVMPSVWAGTDFSLEERCEILSMLGFAGMDLPRPNQIPVLQDYGLSPTLMAGTGTNFNDGFIRREQHEQIFDATLEGLELCVQSRCPNLIGLPGNRRGMSRQEGKENTIEILSRLAPYAEAQGVNICMEITNSKVQRDNRTDQVFDDIYWGFEVCKGVGSPNIKVVYDIYHVQISNGDVVRTLRDNLEHVCHIHVAGVPTRAEIDDTQELNYRYIAKEIADMGYQGFVAHEYRPSPGRNPLVSLAVGYDILTV